MQLVLLTDDIDGVILSLLYNLIVSRIQTMTDFSP
jgi:hypothetical protein